MKKILTLLLMISALVAFTGCGGSDTSDSAGDTYNVDVSNAGDGAVTVNTGSGTVTVNENGNNACLIVDNDTNTTRECTEEERLSTLNRLEKIIVEM